MKVAVVVALLIVASFAHHSKKSRPSLKTINVLNQLWNDQTTTTNKFKKPQQVKNLFYFRTQKTSLPRLNFWPSFKRLKLFSMNAESNKKLNQFSVMPLKLLVLDFTCLKLFQGCRSRSPHCRFNHWRPIWCYQRCRCPHFRRSFKRQAEADCSQFINFILWFVHKISFLRSIFIFKSINIIL